MSEIRKLTIEEIPEFVKIVINAYPGFAQPTQEYFEQFSKRLIELQQNEETIEFYGLFREGKLLGGMRLHQFKMNLFRTMIDVGGVGLVAVDLLHKKEKVAKELIQFFIEHFKEKQNSLALLYPFRPDFYYQMGFGHGTKMNHYSLSPSSFPSTVSKEGLIFLDSSHKELIQDCYHQFVLNHHGMIEKTNQDLEMMFRNDRDQLIGFLQDGLLEGYMIFSLQKSNDENFLHHDLVIKEWIYHNPAALQKMSTFLHSQADQVHRVIINTPDPSLEFFVQDARNGTNRLIPSVYHETNTAGTGLMYKIINLDQFIDQLKGVHFGGENCRFRLKIEDSFLTNLTLHISLKKGKVEICENSKVDFEIGINISDLSSLFMGAIDVMSLYNYGKLKINKVEYLDTLKEMFRFMNKPICFKGF